MNGYKRRATVYISIEPFFRKEGKHFFHIFVELYLIFVEFLGAKKGFYLPIFLLEPPTEEGVANFER